MDEEEHTLHRIAVRRLGRVLMYFGLIISGTLATIFPSKLVEQQVGGWVVTAWSVGMGVSAATCFAGAASDRWLGEYVGLPALCSSIALYGISAIASVTRDNIPLIAFGLLLISFALGLYARWRDVRSIREYALLPIEEDNE